MRNCAIRSAVQYPFLGGPSMTNFACNFKGTKRPNREIVLPQNSMVDSPSTLFSMSPIFKLSIERNMYPKYNSAYPSTPAKEHKIPYQSVEQKNKNLKTLQSKQQQPPIETRIPTIEIPLVNPVSTAPSTAASETENRNSGTRKRKRRPKEPHATARFWAPDWGVGGKARGYAWGFWGSLEGSKEKMGYVRSKDR